MAQPANTGKRRAPTKDIIHTTKSSRVTKPRETTTTTAKKDPVKKAAPKSSTTKAASKKADTSTMAPAAKKTAKRTAEEDVSPPPKRTKSTPSTTTATTKKTATKAAAAKKAVATKPKPAKVTKEAPKAAAKKAVAKKSPAETRKEQQPDINTAPTERLCVFACGEGTAGELGLGPKGIEVKRPRVNNFLDPERVGIVQLSAGGMHVVALTHDSKIMTWGVNDLGALGRDTTWEAPTRDLNSEEDSDVDSDDADMNPHESTPTAVDASYFPAGTKFVQVAAGDSCSFALTSTGLVYGWGTFRVCNHSTMI